MPLSDLLKTNDYLRQIRRVAKTLQWKVDHVWEESRAEAKGLSRATVLNAVKGMIGRA
jgi:hypothetical protein